MSFFDTNTAILLPLNSDHLLQLDHDRLSNRNPDILHNLAALLVHTQNSQKTQNSIEHGTVEAYSDLA